MLVVLAEREEYLFSELGVRTGKKRGRGHASSMAAFIRDQAGIDQVAAENAVEVRIDRIFFRKLANLDLFSFKNKTKSTINQLT